MYEDEILEEVWRVKEQLAAKFERDPAAYWEELKRIGSEWSRRSQKPSADHGKRSGRSARLVRKAS
jgi:hypothetical protein